MATSLPARGQILIVLASVLLGLYVFCPYVIMIPIFVALEHRWLPEWALEKSFAIFAPLQFLDQHVPLYHQMIKAEGDLFIRLGWMPHFE